MKYSDCFKVYNLKSLFLENQTRKVAILTFKFYQIQEEEKKNIFMPNISSNELNLMDFNAVWCIGWSFLVKTLEFMMLIYFGFDDSIMAIWRNKIYQKLAKMKIKLQHNHIARVHTAYCTLISVDKRLNKFLEIAYLRVFFWKAVIFQPEYVSNTSTANFDIKKNHRKINTKMANLYQIMVSSK